MFLNSLVWSVYFFFCVELVQRNWGKDNRPYITGLCVYQLDASREHVNAWTQISARAESRTRAHAHRLHHKSTIEESKSKERRKSERARARIHQTRIAQRQTRTHTHTQFLENNSLFFVLSHKLKQNNQFADAADSIVWFSLTSIAYCQPSVCTNIFLFQAIFNRFFYTVA